MMKTLMGQYPRSRMDVLEAVIHAMTLSCEGPPLRVEFTQDSLLLHAQLSLQSKKGESFPTFGEDKDRIEDLLANFTECRNIRLTSELSDMDVEIRSTGRSEGRVNAVFAVPLHEIDDDRLVEFGTRLAIENGRRHEDNRDLFSKVAAEYGLCATADLYLDQTSPSAPSWIGVTAGSPDETTCFIDKLRACGVSGVDRVDHAGKTYAAISINNIRPRSIRDQLKTARQKLRNEIRYVEKTTKFADLIRANGATVERILNLLGLSTSFEVITDSKQYWAFQVLFRNSYEQSDFDKIKLVFQLHRAFKVRTSESNPGHKIYIQTKRAAFPPSPSGRIRLIPIHPGKIGRFLDSILNDLATADKSSGTGGFSRLFRELVRKIRG